MLHIVFRHYLILLFIILWRRRPRAVTPLCEIKIEHPQPFKESEKQEIKMAFIEKFKALLKDPLFTKTHFPDVEQPDFESAAIVYTVIDKSSAEPNATLSELFVELGGNVLKGKLDCKTVVSLFIYYYLRDFCEEVQACRPRVDDKTDDERLQIFSSVDTNPVNGEPDAMQSFLIRNLSPYDDDLFQTHVFVISNESRSRIKLLTQSIQFYKEVLGLLSPSIASASVDMDVDVALASVEATAAALVSSAPPASAEPPASSEPPPTSPTASPPPSPPPSPLSLMVEEVVDEPFSSKVSFWAPSKSRSKPSNIFGAEPSPGSKSMAGAEMSADVLFVKRAPPPSAKPPLPSSVAILKRAAAAVASSTPSTTMPPPNVGSPAVPLAILKMIEARRARSTTSSA